MRKFNKRVIFGSGLLAKVDADDSRAGEHVKNGERGGFGGKNKGQKGPRIWIR